MSITQTKAAHPQRNLVLEPPETRMVLENIPWNVYVALAESRSGSIPRMTYDEGLLEMMSPKSVHENSGRLIGRMVETYSEVHDIEIISLKSVTVKSTKLSKAFEADESYYVSHAAELLDKDELDFEVDPPPDLVIEVEMTSSAIRKMKLFATMMVPEVWRYDGKTLAMFRLHDREYIPIQGSVELPGLGPDRILATVAKRGIIGENKIIKQFREDINPDRKSSD
jgi:Uma2 family endonuclease